MHMPKLSLKKKNCWLTEERNDNPLITDNTQKVFILIQGLFYRWEIFQEINLPDLPVSALTCFLFLLTWEKYGFTFISGNLEEYGNILNCI